MGPDIEILIQKMSRLPGLGPRSARRVVIHMLKNKERIFEPLLISMSKVLENVKECPVCFNLDTFEEVCSICSDKSRESNIICIVEGVSDLWAIEKTYCFKGKYHVLKGLLSSIEGNGPEVLFLDKLYSRCIENNVSEIIVALSATVEGQTTSHYIRNFFQEKGIKTTTLAHGIPIGGELDYLDEATLSTAFLDRS